MRPRIAAGLYRNRRSGRGAHCAIAVPVADIIETAQPIFGDATVALYHAGKIGHAVAGEDAVEIPVSPPSRQACRWHRSRARSRARADSGFEIRDQATVIGQRRDIGRTFTRETLLEIGAAVSQP